MKTIRTIKLKIVGDTRLDQIAKNYLLAANWLSNHVFKTKDLNSIRLCKAKYKSLRKRHLTSQVACSICRVVCSTYQSMKSNGHWKLAIFQKPSIPVVWRRDFNRTKKGVTLWGKVLTLRGQLLPESGWKDSKLMCVHNIWFLCLSYEIKIPEPSKTGCVVGVDQGVRRMLTATNSNNSKTFFFHGGILNHRRSCIRKTRSKIQSVGTRSSCRLLTRMGRKEAAVTGHLLHVASKALVNYATSVGANRIVMEDLSNVRDASFKKGKDLRSKIHRWPYAKMRFLTTYKAAAKGISMEIVSPHNTSRACPRCGYVEASNRNGLYFHCKKCGHQADADRNASENIRLRSIAIEHNSAAMGSHKPPENSELFEIKLCRHGLV